MSRSGQQRLTPWLLGLAALLAGLDLALLSGLDRAPHWLPALPPSSASPLPPALTVAVPPLQGYAMTWQQPLFNPNRQPDLARAGDPSASLDGLVLSGVVLGQTLRMALLKTPEGKGLSVALGKTLPNGWTLEHLDRDQARFSAAHGEQTLTLHRPKAEPAPQH